MPSEAIHSILIIDDDANNPNRLCDVVFEINASIQCILAVNANEVLLIAKYFDLLPDIIFMGLALTKESGLQCLHALREIEILKYIPIIIYFDLNRSEINSDVLLAAQKMGVSIFFSMPESPDVLKVIVAGIFFKGKSLA